MNNILFKLVKEIAITSAYLCMQKKMKIKDLLIHANLCVWFVRKIQARQVNRDDGIDRGRFSTQHYYRLL